MCEVPLVDVADPLADDDLHLALYCCYELHYRGFDGVDPGWEWDPHLLAALDAGLPDCAGVALGFDRVLMLAVDAANIDEVLAFPTERA